MDMKPGLADTATEKAVSTTPALLISIVSFSYSMNRFTI